MNYLLSLATALLLVLVFPRFGWVWLAPVAVAPLLVAAARETRWSRRLLQGWMAGVVYWFGVCYWIQFVLSVHGGLGGAGGWAVFLLFCFAKALHMAVFAALAGVLMRGCWAIPAVSALWVAIEATHGPLGFAWLALGNAGIEMNLPLRLAPYTGVYGPSFVFMMMATGLALALLRRKRLELTWLAALPLLLLVPAPDAPPRGRSTAVLVQPNIPETERWTPDFFDRTVRNLATLSLRTAIEGGAPAPDIIVWPEVPAPFYYEQDARFRKTVAELAVAARAHVLLGVVAFTPSRAPLNSAQLVSPQGNPVSRYDKVNLVPFGEFVPWPFGFANKISTEIGDFEPGRKVVVSPLGAHRLGAFVCYESVFPHYVRKFARDGAEVLFNLSNDGYFGRSAAREQHLLIVRMRAAENRRWILRATNDGITATIDTAGRLRGTLPPYVNAASYTGFSYETRRTVYTRFGDWFAALCGLASAAALAVSRAGSRARRHP